MRSFWEFKNGWAHWQNLNEGPDGKPRPGFPWAGRAWINVGVRRDSEEELREKESARVEWNLKSRSCHLVLHAAPMGGDDTWSGSVAFPPIALYYGVTLKKTRWLSRAASWLASKARDMNMKWSGAEVSIRIHDWSIWWNFLVDDYGWTSTRPRWRDGNFNIPDFFLGKHNYDSRVIEKKDIVVCMPEGQYRGSCELREDSWSRPLWTTKRIVRAHIDMADPIPFPGKGTASYNCGQDAAYGLTCPASTFAEAVGKLTESVLSDRYRHGGADWRPKPQTPSESGGQSGEEQGPQQS